MTEQPAPQGTTSTLPPPSANGSAPPPPPHAARAAAPRGRCVPGSAACAPA